MKKYLLVAGLGAMAANVFGMFPNVSGSSCSNEKRDYYQIANHTEKIKTYKNTQIDEIDIPQDENNCIYDSSFCSDSDCVNNVSNNGSSTVNKSPIEELYKYRKNKSNNLLFQASSSNSGKAEKTGKNRTDSVSNYGSFYSIDAPQDENNCIYDSSFCSDSDCVNNVSNNGSSTVNKSPIEELYEYCKNESNNLSLEDLKFEYETLKNGEFTCILFVKGTKFEQKNMAYKSKKMAKNKIAEYVCNKLKNGEASFSKANYTDAPQDGNNCIYASSSGSDSASSNASSSSSDPDSSGSDSSNNVSNNGSSYISVIIIEGEENPDSSDSASSSESSEGSDYDYDSDKTMVMTPIME